MTYNKILLKFQMSIWAYMLFFPVFLLGSEGINMPEGGGLIIKGATFFHISNHSNVLLKFNLKTSSDITGGGKLIMNTSQNAFIEAPKQQISNLELTGEHSTFLYSELFITQSLEIKSGKLYLFDNNLVITEYARIADYSFHRIIRNGRGFIKIFHHNREHGESLSTHNFVFKYVTLETISDIISSIDCVKLIFEYSNRDLQLFPDVDPPPPKFGV